MKRKSVYNIHVIKKRKIEEINDIDPEFPNVYAVFFCALVPFKLVLFQLVSFKLVPLYVIISNGVVVTSVRIVDVVVNLTNELINGMS